jgi:transposase
MMVIGVDPHKQSHTAVAADELGRKKAQRTVRARRDGHREVIAWAREVAPAGRQWADDVRHVAGGLIRELLAAGEQVVFVPPKLMAGSGAAGGSGASPTRSTRWRSRGWRCARARACPPPASMSRCSRCGG